MLGRLRRLLRLRGPLGALALAAALGVLTGLLALNAVLAAWTYRDAARRDRRAPGRWALGVLVGGVFAFGPYVLLQWLADRSEDGGVAGAVRRAVRERRSSDAAGGREVAMTPEAAESDGGTEGDREAGVETDAVATADGDGAASPETEGDSLALTTARFGVRAAGLGARGARWAGRRAVARMNDR